MAATGVSAQQSTYNTTPYDSLDPGTSGGRYSALWGYTGPDNREYALLGGFAGTHIVDITEKPIKQVAFIEGPKSGWREMKTYSHYAYIVSEGGGGLQIVDLSGLPESAELVASDTSVFRTGHTITIQGTWVYVNGSNKEAGANQGTLIFSIADNPEKPVLVGKYDRGYVHDVQVRNDTMYAAMINDGRLDIVYLGEDRTEPVLVTDIVYPGGGTHNSDLTTDGHYVMTTDEIGETRKTLKVWDISDVGDIVKVADWTADPNAIIHNVHIRGTVAYISWYTAGTRIVDISDPLNPVEIGFYDFYPGSGQHYDGNWEVYPYFASGKIISSDMGKGLFVFTFGGAKKGLANGIVRDAATKEPLSNVVVRFPDLGRTVYSDDNGRFTLLAAEGEIAYNAFLSNYRLASGTIELTSDGTETEILMEKLRLRDIRIVAVDKGTKAPISNFAFDVRTRGESEVDPQHQIALHLPADSGYSVVVGAWGWLPAEIGIQPNVEGDVEVELERGYSDDAELDLGWSYGLPDDDGVGGTWERGTPVGVEVSFNGGDPVPVEPSLDHTPGSGTRAFLTQIIDSPDTAPGLADVDSGRVTLTSPEFDLSEYLDPSISFALWYSNDAFPFVGTDDKLYVRISNDGGQSWKAVETLDHGFADWTEYNVRVADILEPTSTMLFRVVASDSGQQGWTEAGLDDFLVTGERISSVTNRYSNGSESVSVRITPNPVRDGATLSIESDVFQTGASIGLFDGLGRDLGTLFEGDLQAGHNTVYLDTSRLAAGVYHLRFWLPDGTEGSRKLTVVR